MEENEKSVVGIIRTITELKHLGSEGKLLSKTIQLVGDKEFHNITAFDEADINEILRNHKEGDKVELIKVKNGKYWNVIAVNDTDENAFNSTNTSSGSSDMPKKLKAQNWTSPEEVLDTELLKKCIDDAREIAIQKYPDEFAKGKTVLPIEQENKMAVSLFINRMMKMSR